MKIDAREIQHLPDDATIWVELTNKISEECRGMFEDDFDTTISGRWIGLYKEGLEDPTFVFRDSPEFTATCLQHYNVTFLNPAPCFTMGTHFGCLRVWEHPLRVIEKIFRKIKVIYTNRGPQIVEEKDREKNHLLL